MKYQCSIHIPLPMETVAGLFQDPLKLSKWQEGFVALKPVEGELNENGSKIRLLYRLDGHVMDVMETVEENSLPNSFTAVYKSKDMQKRITSKFRTVDDETTRWDMDCELKFRGAKAIFSPFYRESVKRKASTEMARFKLFALHARESALQY